MLWIATRATSEHPLSPEAGQEAPAPGKSRGENYWPVFTLPK